MSSSSSEFRIACASDLHLGHSRVGAQFMIENLRRSFYQGKEFAALDVLVLAGDVLDHLLTWGQDDVKHIQSWMIEIMRLCAVCDVELWVLEGTPSHDRRQSSWFVELNEQHKLGCKLTYADTLSIHYFQRFDIHVLFVPDEWSESAEQTLFDVHLAMKEKGLKKVDYAIMHGQFEYQLPEHVPAQKHDSQAYLALVDKLIFIGHIHIHSKHDRIIAQGSHDRISHGEEAPKGYVRALVRSGDDYELEFVENTGAALFKTIELEEVELSDAIAACRAFALQVPDESFLRIRANSENYSLSQLENEMAQEFPLINWSSIAKDSKERIRKLEKELLAQSKLPDLITITPENVERLVHERIFNVHSSTSESAVKAMELLKELV